MRLSKRLSQLGYCSRREADEFISRGWVLVDGQPVSTLGARVDEHQVVALAPEAVQVQESQVTFILNKPVGYVSGQPEDGYPPAVQLITSDNQDPTSVYKPALLPKHFVGLAPAGRLDIDSRGLLVFTQDGRIAKRLTSETGEISKEYIVRVSRRPSPEQLRRLCFGLELDGRKLRRATVEETGDCRLRFILNEGRNRQIRRMCDLVGLEILSLMRIRIGNIRMGNLPEGCWRYLRENESF